MHKYLRWNCWLLFLVLCGSEISAQERSSGHAHSHNDYEQARPFQLAYQHGFGSIEADVYLQAGDLKVAHNREDIRPERNLINLYLRPLDSCIRNNRGWAYPDSSQQLILLIDPKTEGISTLQELIRQLQRFPALRQCPTLRIVITGNQPPIDQFCDYPDYIWFDGNLKGDYDSCNLNRIILFSANFKTFSSWKGVGPLPMSDSLKIQKAIDLARRYHRPVRFWNAPDNPNAWKTLSDMGVGYINTDKIEALSAWILEGNGP
ncbi:hypothetical protein GCM10027051_31770 [Niabella terrae]